MPGLFKLIYIDKVIQTTTALQHWWYLGWKWDGASRPA